jgi:hypothetical protein
MQVAEAARRHLSDLDARITAMDAASVDAQVVSPIRSARLCRNGCPILVQIEHVQGRR